MPLPRPLLLLVLALPPHLTGIAADADASAVSERAALAGLLTFGRPVPTPTGSAGPLAAQLAQLRTELAGNREARERAAGAAWRDAFGREPTAAEWSVEIATPPFSYIERMQRHLTRLRAAPLEYREVIRRAYRLVVHRDAYAEEFEYWHPHGVLSFVVLVACIEDWARRNQPGLMVTAGRPTVPARSRFVTIVPVTPALATEVRAAFPTGEATADASRVLALGADRVATPGGMHVALVGRD